MIARSRLRRALPYVVTLGAALILYQVAARIDYSARPGTLGPDFWPKVVLGVLIVVCLSEIVAKLFLSNDGAPAGVLQDLMRDAGPDAAEEQPEGRYTGRLILGLAAAVLYVPAVDWLGFFLATWAFIIVFLRAGGYRRLGMAALIGGVTSLAFMFIFMKLVYVSLPLGRGPFQPLSVMLLQALGIR